MESIILLKTWLVDELKAINEIDETHNIKSEMPRRLNELRSNMIAPLAKYQNFIEYTIDTINLIVDNQLKRYEALTAEDSQEKWDLELTYGKETAKRSISFFRQQLDQLERMDILAEQKK